MKKLRYAIQKSTKIKLDYYYYTAFNAPRVGVTNRRHMPSMGEGVRSATSKSVPMTHHHHHRENGRKPQWPLYPRHKCIIRLYQYV